MANVLFKRGTQSNLTKYLYDYTGSDRTTAVEGCFYLTSDTNRLYIGKDFGGAIGVKAVPVNQGAIPVDTVNNLPIPDAAIPGQFYYVVGSNILCVAAGGNWVQVNTNTDNYIGEKQTVGTYDSTNHKSSITEILFNTNNVRIEDTIEYIGANGLDVSVAPKYELAKYFISGIQYYTYESGTYLTTSTPTAQNWPIPNTQYYIRRGYALTFTPPTYTLTASVTSNNLTLNVSDGGSNSSSVTINHGSNITFTESNGTITLNGSDAYVDKVKAGSGNSPASGVAYNGNGDTNGVTSSTKGFYTQVHNSSGATAGAWIDPQIKVGGESAYQQTVQFDNGVATLPVYTTTEIDNKIRMFNAMEYQGVTDSNTFDRTASNIKNGYVWMAQDTITVDPTSNPQLVAHAGDLIIAYGVEDGPNDSHPGYIPYQNIQWQIVTSGASFDTQPVVDVSNSYPSGIAIGKSIAGGANARVILGVFQVDVNGTAQGAGQYLGISETINGTTKLVRITHSETNATTSANSTHTDANGNDIIHSVAVGGGAANKSTFDIPVPVISYDAAGHITGITTYAYQVVDSHLAITQPTLTATSSAATSATITNQFKADGQNITSTMNVTSDSITLGANSGALVMNIEWGAFS